MNIASFALGRSKSDRAKPGQPATSSSSRVSEGHALAVVQLDIPQPDGSTSTSPELEQALTALRKVDAITSVRTVELGKL